MPSIDQFVRGTTVRVKASVVDSDNAAATPSVSIKVTVEDPQATEVVDDQAMTALATGSYIYRYNSAADALLGKYTVEVTTVDGSPAETVIQQGEFELIARTT